MDLQSIKIEIGEFIKLITSLKNEKWSGFVQSHSKGNIFQTPEMMAVYKGTRRYEPVFLAVLDESDEIQALLLAHLIKEMNGFLGAFSSRTVIQGGPLLVENSKYMNSLILLMHEYDNIVKKKALYTQIRNLINRLELLSSLKERGYQYEDHLNFLLDLKQPLEDIWNNMDKHRKYGIRRAKKFGIVVAEVEDKQSLEIVYDLLQQTYKSARWPLADKTLFESALEILAPKKMVKFFLAKYNKNYIGTMTILLYKGVAYNWYVGAARNYLHLYPNDLLYWHAIEWSKQNSYMSFDFGGAGKPNEEYGVRDFKKKFGGKLVNFGRFEKVYHPKKLWFSKKIFKICRWVTL